MISASYMEEPWTWQKKRARDMGRMIYSVRYFVPPGITFGWVRGLFSLFRVRWKERFSHNTGLRGRREANVGKDLISVSIMIRNGKSFPFILRRVIIYDVSGEINKI